MATPTEPSEGRRAHKRRKADDGDDANETFKATHRPEKPSAKAQPGHGRLYTLSVALPGSILSNAQTWELRTALVGQIARACGIYSVDEIIVFDEPVHLVDSVKPLNTVVRGKYRKVDGEETTHGDQEFEDYDPCKFMSRILEYLECPQYLRKSLFPLHPDLRLAGLLPPLDLPHHLRRDDVSTWREACILPSTHTTTLIKQKHNTKNVRTLWADIGLYEPVEVNIKNAPLEALPPWTRITVKMPHEKKRRGDDDDQNKKVVAKLARSSDPKQTQGLYWGYTIRKVDSISKVLTESPFAKDGGYDLTIGTSERGQDVNEVIKSIPTFRHALVVLGGLAGLELTIASDTTLTPNLTADQASTFFNHWINVLPGQGSRTVRTEEALLVALSSLRQCCIEKGIRP